MTICSSQSRVRSAWGGVLAALLLAVTLPLAASNAAQAQRRAQPQMQGGPAQPGPHGGTASQASLRSEFRTALEPHGRWQQHKRFGDVWIPGNRPAQWRPYTAGRWVYTNDWGWYWVSDDAEARWGWITYHYGRWAYDDDDGWCWVPGEEWSPAWVQWRRPRAGVEYVGWAPLPPDEIIVDYVEQPRFWIFVRGRDFIAPRLATVILPVNRYDVFFRETVVVNRTLLVDDRARFAVNPGIEPTIIAAATRQPLRTYDVRPTILAGTAAAIAGATQVRAENLRNRDFRPQPALQPTQNVVRAADRVQPAQPLAAGERGRLGGMPPRAAQRGQQAPSTTGQAPGTSPPAQPQQQRQPQQAQPQQPQPKQAQPQQQQAQPKQAQPQTKQAQPQQQQAQPKQAQPQTKQAQPKQAQPQQAQPQQQQQQGQRQPQRQQQAQPQRPSTEGRGAAEQRQPPSSERRATPQPQRQQPSAQQQRPSTEGRGGGGPPQAGPAPRTQGGATEGRGGGGPQRAPGGGGPGGGRGGQGPGGSP
jgi:hypothetical protein